MANQIPIYEIEIHYNNGMIKVDDIVAHSREEAETYGNKLIERFKADHPDWNDLRMNVVESMMDQDDFKGVDANN